MNPRGMAVVPHSCVGRAEMSVHTDGCPFWVDGERPCLSPRRETAQPMGDCSTGRYVQVGSQHDRPHSLSRTGPGNMLPLHQFELLARVQIFLS